MALANNVLVTGGAGYIGSHTTLQLVDSGHNVVVVDNLYSGHEWAIAEQARFYQGDIRDQNLIANIISDHQIDSVIHFAGHIVVPESVENPAKYYDNNVLGSLNLIQTSIDCGIRNFVFSSSAAVYGIPDHSPVSEQTLLRPINPYGSTKLITEWTLNDLSLAAKQDFSYVALRYFNVAGAHMGGQLGQSTPNATHLIKVACQTATAQRQSMAVFGDDYDTPDGSCIRDYIHVDDLASAHLCALDYLDQGGKSDVFNCGYGQGFSVKQVIDCVRRASNVDFEAIKQPRRAGDPPQLIANNEKIKRALSWQPKYNDLMTICQSALQWEQKLVEMSKDQKHH